MVLNGLQHASRNTENTGKFTFYLSYELGDSLLLG